MWTSGGRFPSPECFLLGHPLDDYLCKAKNRLFGGLFLSLRAFPVNEEVEGVFRYKPHSHVSVPDTPDGWTIRIHYSPDREIKSIRIDIHSIPFPTAMLMLPLMTASLDLGLNG